MIRLTNDFEFAFMGGSGALGLTGLGWPHPKYWWLNFLLRKYPNLIIPVIKTLTLSAQEGDYGAIYDGDDYVVNAVGLKNPGFKAWREKYFPNIEKRNQKVILSIAGSSVIEIEMLAHLIVKLPKHIIKGIEFNCSCPNVKKEWRLEEIIKAMSILSRITDLPIGIKLARHQKNFLEIVKATFPWIEWISFNSVPWEIVFPGRESPLMKKYGVPGAVSGKAIKDINKNMALEIKKAGIKTPIVASSVGWEGTFETACLDVLFSFRWVDAVSFGSLFRKRPLWPLRIAQKYFGKEIK